MKKILILVGVFSILSFSSNANSKITEEYFAFLDCNALAQGYYEYLVNDEGVEPREAGRRARQFRDACEEIQEPIGQ